jgi:hypothetical protein
VWQPHCHCERQRSNPANRKKLDCFVAFAPLRKRLAFEPYIRPIPQQSRVLCSTDKNKSEFYREAESEMSKEPKIEHEYHAHKDRLTIKIHRYSLESKKTRDAILMKLIANLESKPDRLKAEAKKKAKKGSGKKLRGQPKTSRLVEIGD